jgi:hypothetical protein
VTTWTLRETYEGPQGAVAWDRFGDGPPVVLLHGASYDRLALVDAVTHGPWGTDLAQEDAPAQLTARLVEFLVLAG